MKKPEFSLILACYNEGEHFTKSAKIILATLKKTKLPFEIIFVEDKSTDDTKQLIEAFFKKHPKEPIKVFFHARNKGRGQTVTDGIVRASGKIVGFIDIDLEIGSTYIPEGIRVIQKGYDVAFGVRQYQFSIRSVIRWIASRTYQKVTRLILAIPFDDTEAGYKFFRRKTILPIIKKTQNKGWFWDTEIMALSLRSGLRMKALPVTFIKRSDKTSTVRLFSDTIEYLKNLYQFKQRFANPVNDSIAQYWKKEAVKWNDLYGPFSLTTIFLRARHRVIAKILKQLSNKKVLDVGCGNGVFMDEIIQNNGYVVGLDYSKEMLKLAQTKLTTYSSKFYQLICSDATKIPFSKSSFDVILASGLTDYLGQKDNEKFLKESSRVLKKKGIIIVTFPKKNSPFAFLRRGFGLVIRERLLKLPPILSSFVEGEVETMMKTAGFSLIDKHNILATMWVVVGVKK